MTNPIFSPFIFSELRYISGPALTERLKRKDPAYYLDDINFLSLQDDENLLCGYLPDSDPTDCFCYTIANRHPEHPSKLLPPREMILSCTDASCMERFLSILCAHKPPVKGICFNLPCEAAPSSSRSFRDILKALTAPYRDLMQEAAVLYDYRFPESCLPIQVESEKYRIEEDTSSSQLLFNVYEDQSLLFRYAPNTFSDPESNIPTLHQTAQARLGIRAVSFSDNVVCFSKDPLPREAIVFCLSSISNLCLHRGYLVKNIALPGDFENEDLCIEIGMTRFRQFIRYKATY